MVDFVNALKKPFSDMQKLVIGIIIGIIPIVNLLIEGYGVKTAQATIKGDQKLPEWSVDLGDLIIKSILVLVIWFIYMLIPLLILGAGLSVAGTTFFSKFANPVEFQDPAVVESFLTSLMSAGGFFLIAMLLFLFVVFILPAAVVLFAREQNFSVAFNFNNVLRNAFSSDYVVAWIFSIVFAIIIIIIGLIISIIPLIGVFIASGFVNFSLAVFTFTVFAEAVKK